MNPFSTFPNNLRQSITHVLTDIDDTLTLDGILPAAAYSALERLHQSGIKIIPITGRPAGWCDHIARMWPVDGVVGENGAFYFLYDHQCKKMVHRYWDSESVRIANRHKLETLKQKILSHVRGCSVSADQRYRDADLAIDFCEDIEPLNEEEISTIVSLFESAGAQAKISSIHVNGWFGDFDKLAMTRKLFTEVYNIDLDSEKERIIYVGDSPNDVPMFRYFPHSVGVANVRDHLDLLSATPNWITRKKGGLGFSEMADILLNY